MSTNPNIQFNYSPGIQSLIPLFYAAWADRVLTPSEIQTLTEKGLKLSFIKEEDLLLIKLWSNPLKPPSKHLFKYWEISIKNAAERLEEQAYVSLVDLGLEMAQSAAKKVKNDIVVSWDHPHIRK